MVELHNGPTSLGMVREGIENPYYRGTRFDRSGIILSLSSAVFGQKFNYGKYCYDYVK